MDSILTGISFIIFAIIYFLPSIIALMSGKTNFIAIGALNLFLGCTIIGWVVSLVWSLSSDNNPQRIVINKQNEKIEEDEMDKINKLKKLLDDQAITQEEFDIQKRRILNL